MTLIGDITNERFLPVCLCLLLHHLLPLGCNQQLGLLSLPARGEALSWGKGMRSSSASQERPWGQEASQLAARSRGDWLCLQLHERVHRPEEGSAPSPSGTAEATAGCNSSLGPSGRGARQCGLGAGLAQPKVKGDPRASPPAQRHPRDPGGELMGRTPRPLSPDFSMEMENRRHKCTWPSTHCLELTSHSPSTRAALSNSTVPVQGPQN